MSHTTPAVTSVTRRSGSVAKRSSAPNAAVIAIFVICLLVPIQIYLGSIRLTPYRVLLLVLVVPSILSVFAGKCGKVRASDVLILLYVIWATVALMRHHPLNEILEATGIFAVETMGAYFLARRYVRTASDFESLVRVLFVAAVISIPFAIYENLTSRPIVLDIIGNLFTVYPNEVKQPRWGLDRAQFVFEHPILYGVFCATSFGLTLYVLCYGKSRVGQMARLGGVCLATFTCLSSGALVALVFQGCLAVYEAMTRRLPSRWPIFTFAFVLMYVLVDAVSNRTPLRVFISYLTFNTGSAWERVHIWEWGMRGVFKHPLFGIGLNDWERDWWMTGSMDNFWLVLATRYGIPGFLFIALAVVLICVGIGRVNPADERIRFYRTGLVITLVALSIAGTTVHYWNAIYCLFMFLMGSGMWMLNAEQAEVSRRGRPDTYGQGGRQTSPAPPARRAMAAPEDREAS